MRRQIDGLVTGKPVLFQGLHMLADGEPVKTRPDIPLVEGNAHLRIQGRIQMPRHDSVVDISTTGSVDALYSRWYGGNRLELSAHYHLIYTDAFSEDNPVLETEAWNDVLQLKSRFSGPTRLTSIGRPWRWLLYANHSNFLSQDNLSLGYTSLFEFGFGMEWQMNIKPMDWFGWQMIGLKAGVITSSNVEGYFMGLTAR